VEPNTQIVKTVGLVSLALLALWVFRSKRPSSHFSLAELTKTSTGLPNVPSSTSRTNLEKLANQILEPLRERFGPIIVNSGFRSVATNAAVGGVSNSDHLTGKAADISAQDGTPASTLAAWLFDSTLPLEQVLIYWNTGHLHVSLDTNGTPYRRDFLQTFDGKNYEAWTPGGRIS
jgi:zinc D-Ala-D-Ala carboxypeptidase